MKVKVSNTVKVHPLAEILQKKLFGITEVPEKEQKRMVRRAIKAAVEFHDIKETIIITKNDYIGLADLYDNWFICNKCKNYFSEESNYCSGCGKEIDWGLHEK